MNPPPLVGPVRKLTDSRFLNLFTADVHRPTGPRPWIFASRKQQPLTGPIRPDAVAMIVLVKNEAGPQLLVIREFRAPINAYELALPSGLVDDGETPEVAAKRELFEETGLNLTRIAHISPPVASSAGLTDETVCLVYGEAAGTISDQHLQQHEQIEARLLNFSDVCALLRNPPGDVISVRLYAALVGFFTAGGITLPPTQGS